MHDPSPRPAPRLSIVIDNYNYEQFVARAIDSALEQTVAEGTAQDASGLPGGAEGKTGTAQTGQFTAEGKERKNLWFAGFYPAEDPQYTIVVLQDGQTQAAVSSAAVFAQLCTALHWLG